ncbi:MAG: hypothetical protein AB7I59_12570 [Geminicoccaceae bacterium]
MIDISPLSSRRDLLTGLIGGSLALGAGTLGFAAPAAAAAGPRSGRSWHTGASINEHSKFAAFRGRPLDTITCWCQHDNWSQVVGLKGGFVTAKKSGARVSLAIAPLPRSHDGKKNKGNWKLAANGSFDGYYSQFAQKLASSGAKNPIVRIGWEINGKSRPWFCGTDAEAFKATWQRIAGILRRYNPGVQTEWSNIKKGAQPGSILNYYPGDQYVDIVGVNYYDGWPALSTQSAWNSQYDADYKGGPYGLGAWYQFARSRGKQLACSEWGINAGRYGCIDNPLYIENMHGFFARNSGAVAYENYFNQKSYHQIMPGTRNPKASAKYRQLWG